MLHELSVLAEENLNPVLIISGDEFDFISMDWFESVAATHFHSMLSTAQCSLFTVQKYWQNTFLTKAFAENRSPECVEISAISWGLLYLDVLSRRHFISIILSKRFDILSQFLFFSQPPLSTYNLITRVHSTSPIISFLSLSDDNHPRGTLARMIHLLLTILEWFTPRLQFQDATHPDHLWIFLLLYKHDRLNSSAKASAKQQY